MEIKVQSPNFKVYKFGRLLFEVFNTGKSYRFVKGKNMFYWCIVIGKFKIYWLKKI